MHACVPTHRHSRVLTCCLPGGKSLVLQLMGSCMMACTNKPTAGQSILCSAMPVLGEAVTVHQCSCLTGSLMLHCAGQQEESPVMAAQELANEPIAVHFTQRLPTQRQDWVQAGRALHLQASLACAQSMQSVL